MRAQVTVVQSTSTCGVSTQRLLDQNAITRTELEPQLNVVAKAGVDAASAGRPRAQPARHRADSPR